MEFSVLQDSSRKKGVSKVADYRIIIRQNGSTTDNFRNAPTWSARPINRIAVKKNLSGGVGSIENFFGDRFAIEK